MKMIEEEAYSRIPVHSGELDSITGILYAREYLLKRNNADFDITQTIKEPIFVPETKKLDVLFKEMQDSHNHMVVVVNEYGLTSGIVTMEDILEEIVGEIWDEVDEAIETITPQTDTTFIVDTSIYIDTLFDYFEVQKPDNIESTTVNGWIIEQLGDIPIENYSFEYDKLRITVIEVDAVQTQKILVEILSTVIEQTEN
jgi:CBS domain containing-hemolysin-like protein